MSGIQPIQKEYGHFELRVQKVMNLCAEPFCSLCQSCCCQHVICEESVLSPFLLGVHKQFPPTDLFCDTYGWLSTRGCTLTAGRPPVCYEFLCDVMMTNLPNDDTRYALRTLGMLVTHLGRNALGGRHLVELSEDDLDRVRLDRFTKRLQECRRVFDDLEHFFSSGMLSTDARERMSKVCRPDINLYQGD